jgi:hypothetical protein
MAIALLSHPTFYFPDYCSSEWPARQLIALLSEDMFHRFTDRNQTRANQCSELLWKQSAPLPNSM